MEDWSPGMGLEDVVQDDGSIGPELTAAGERRRAERRMYPTDQYIQDRSGNYHCRDELPAGTTRADLDRWQREEAQRAQLRERHWRLRDAANAKWNRDTLPRIAALAAKKLGRPMCTCHVVQWGDDVHGHYDVTFADRVTVRISCSEIIA